MLVPNAQKNTKLPKTLFSIFIKFFTSAGFDVRERLISANFVIEANVLHNLTLTDHINHLALNEQISRSN